MIPIITDSHFGSKNFSKSVFEMQIQFYEKQFFPWCIKNKVTDVIHCGDIVHNRNLIDLYILQELKRRFFKWFEDNQINLHIDIGNHDSYYKSGIEYNFLSENINEFSYVHSYDKPIVKKIGKYKFGFMPWVTDERNVNLPDPEEIDVLVGHFDIKSFIIMMGVTSTEGFNPEDFTKYKMVISGHYHNRSSRGNIHYIGTQYPLSWSDFEEPKGFAVLDNKFGLKWIENEVSPRFVKIFYRETELGPKYFVRGFKKDVTQEIHEDQAIDISKNNYVKLICEKIIDHNMFDQFFNSVQMVSRDNFKIEIIDANEIIESFDFEEIEEKIREESNTFDTVKTFIGGMTFESDIDKENLVDYFIGLYREAEEATTLIQTQREY